MSLVIRNVFKSFDLEDGSTFLALKGINLEIKRGEFCTFLGPSGCGKTTLLRIIAGFETPCDGTIIYNQKPLENMAVNKRGFPMVFQSYALFPHMTVWDNIAYGLRLKKLPRKVIDQKVSAIISMVELGPNQNKFPTQMSGGQQQRVALARALVMEPEIILFDEPLSNLDAKLRVYMREEIRSIQERLGITAIYVTHDQEEAMAISDRIVVMNQGEVEQFGPPKEIYHRPDNQFVSNFIGTANIIPISNVSADGFKLLGKNYDTHDNLQGKTKVVLRPENITLKREGTGHPGEVQNVSFHGPKWHYRILAHDQILKVEVPSSSGKKLMKGDEVRLDFHSDQFHFID